MRITLSLFLLVFFLPSNANELQTSLIEQQAAEFFDDYLAVYNRRFGHPNRSAQFRLEIGEIAHMPLLLAPPGGQPQVPESRESVARNFERFLSDLESKGVTKLQWQQVSVHVLTPNRVLANNIGQGVNDAGEILYETISIYLLVRNGNKWQIAMFSPYDLDKAVHID